MNDYFFEQDKPLHCGNPWHGVIRTASGVNTLTMANGETKQVYGTFNGEVWYFKHPDAVAADTPASLDALGGKWYEDAIFSSDDKIYTLSTNSGTNSPTMGTQSVWLRVRDDGEVWPVKIVVDQIGTSSCRVTVSYGGKRWNPLSPASFGTWTQMYQETLSSTVLSSPIGNASGKVSDVRRDGRRALITHGYEVYQNQNRDDLGHINLSCWELTLDDEDVTASAVFQLTSLASAQTNGRLTDDVETYIDRRVEYWTTATHKNWKIYETWWKDLGLLWSREIFETLMFACYNAAGDRVLMKSTYDKTNYSCQGSDHFIRYVDEYLVYQVSVLLADPDPALPDSPVGDRISVEAHSQEALDPVPDPDLVKGITENGTVVLAPNYEEDPYWDVSFWFMWNEMITRHILKVPRFDGNLEVHDLYLVAPGVVKEISIPGTGVGVLAAYNHRVPDIYATDTSAHSNIAVI